jgi:hypothetical protein
LLGAHYFGELPESEIAQPDWYIHIKVGPVLGLSVVELLALPDLDYQFWVTRALATLSAEAEAQELIRFAEQRNR